MLVICESWRQSAGAVKRRELPRDSALRRHRAVLLNRSFTASLYDFLCSDNITAKAMFPMTKYEASILPRLLTPLLAGLLVSAAYHSNAQAAAIGAYVISDQDGYGMLDCLTQKSDCGKVVADSWCEAHGHGAARAYGRADDVTASIGKSALRQTAGPGSAIIACNE